MKHFTGINKKQKLDEKQLAEEEEEDDDGQEEEGEEEEPREKDNCVDDEDDPFAVSDAKAAPAPAEAPAEKVGESAAPAPPRRTIGGSGGRRSWEVDMGSEDDADPDADEKKIEFTRRKGSKEVVLQCIVRSCPTTSAESGLVLSLLLFLFLLPLLLLRF